MSKAQLYSRLAKGWRQWDEDVYRLATSMLSAFSEVIRSEEADPGLVAEITHLRDEVERYEIWCARGKAAS